MYNKLTKTIARIMTKKTKLKTKFDTVEHNLSV